MNRLNYQQKISMMRILLDIVNADGIIDEREKHFFNQLMEKYHLTPEDKEVVDEKNSLLALLEIKEFNKSQKEEFASLMKEMIIIDRDINVNEVAIYEVVANFCGIEKAFSEYEIPEGITRSE